MFDGVPGDETPPVAAPARGRRVDKKSQAYKESLYAAQKALPQSSAWTFGAVQLFHNTKPRPCQTEWTAKLSATCETEYDLLTSASRYDLCADRYASLSPPTKFVRNFAPSRKKTRGSRLDEEFERPIFTDIVGDARKGNRALAPDQPPCLLGCFATPLYGAGTVRNGGAFAYLYWVPGDLEWQPVLVVTSYTGDEAFPLVRPAGQRLPGRIGVDRPGLQRWLSGAPHRPPTDRDGKGRSPGRSTGAGMTRPPADLRPLQAMLLPWWIDRAALLATHLETALETGQTVIWDSGGRRYWSTADQLAQMAEEAFAQIEKLEACLRE